MLKIVLNQSISPDVWCLFIENPCSGFDLGSSNSTKDSCVAGFSTAWLLYRFSRIYLVIEKSQTSHVMISEFLFPDIQMMVTGVSVSLQHGLLYPVVPSSGHSASWQHELKAAAASSTTLVPASFRNWRRSNPPKLGPNLRQAAVTHSRSSPGRCLTVTGSRVGCPRQQSLSVAPRRASAHVKGACHQVGMSHIQTTAWM